MRVLVTGATGFVGRALCSALRARGDEVHALVRSSSPEPARQRLARLGVQLAPGDVREQASIERAAAGAALVVHLAATRPRAASAAEHEAVNLVGTENALEAARVVGAARFVHLSSATVTAGNYPRDYIDENFPHAPVFLTAFDESKAVAEGLVLAASGRGNMRTVALRPGWVWGPDDTVLLPELIRRTRARTLVVPGSGQQFVPATYVDNLVAAVLCAAEADAAAGNAYYVTDDERISCKNFLTRLLGAVGMGAPRRREPYAIAYARAWASEALGLQPEMDRADVVRFGRVALFNLTRTRADLGWAPPVPIQDGLKRTGAWAASVGGAEAIASGTVLEPTG